MRKKIDTFDILLRKGLKGYVNQIAELPPTQMELEDNYQFSEEFERKKQEILARARKQARKKPILFYISTFAKRAAVFLITVMVVTTVTVFGVDGLRGTLFEFVDTMLLDDISNITFEMDKDDKGLGGRINYQVDADAQFETAGFELAYVPEGFELDMEDLALQPENKSHYHYQNADGAVLEVSQYVSSGYAMVNTEGMMLQEIDHAGFKGLDAKDKRGDIVFVSDGSCVYGIFYSSSEASQNEKSKPKIDINKIIEGIRPIRH